MLEIYKLHVEMTDRLVNRRGTMNQFYIGLLTALIGLVALLDSKQMLYFQFWTNITIGIVGLAICTVWKISVNSYKKLSYAKFETLTKMEEQLEFQFYTYEWKIVKTKTNYKNITKLENKIPIVMMFPFLLLVVYSIFGFTN